MILATSYSAKLPPWLIPSPANLAATLSTLDERIQLVNDLPDHNWRAGNSGPFAAIVVDEAFGALLSIGRTSC